MEAGPSRDENLKRKKCQIKHSRHLGLLRCVFKPVARSGRQLGATPVVHLFFIFSLKAAAWLLGIHASGV